MRSVRKAFGRNNLWISAKGGQMWSVSSDARTWRTDLDYDGFDWGSGSYPFIANGTIYYDRMIAASVLSMVPMLVIFFFSQRYFIEGIQLTGMKG